LASDRVKKVTAERGFGFIAADDGDGNEDFFQRTALRGSVDLNRLVGGEHGLFEIEQSAKGPRAVRVAIAAGRADR